MRANRGCVLWAIGLLLITDVGAGVAHGQREDRPERDDRPEPSGSIEVSDLVDVQTLIDRTTDDVSVYELVSAAVSDSSGPARIVGGRDSRRAGPAHGGFAGEFEPVEQDAPRAETELYGMRPDGTVGVIGVCVSVPIGEVPADVRQALVQASRGLPAPVEYIQDCRAAPGVTWPVPTIDPGFLVPGLPTAA